MTTIIENGGTLAAPSGARIKVRVITAGTGSSGIYPAEAIESAAPLIARGTPIYADHPTVSEGFERPERSVRDLVGFFETPGTYVKESHAVDAEATILPQWREAVAAMHEHIGMSIRATADVDESQGKRVITRINSIESVDLVTKAGRGGKVLQLLESARPSVQVQETTDMDMRDRLDNAVRAAHGDAHVLDRDDTYVYFRIWARDDGPSESNYRQTYTTTDTTVTLTGEKQPVVRSTEYKPITDQEAPVADTQNTKTEEAGKNPFANQNTNTKTGGGEKLDPKDQKIADLEAQVADLKAQLKAAKPGTKESAQDTNGEGGEVNENQGENPGIDYAKLAEAIAAHASANGAGTPTGMGRVPVAESRPDAGITNPSAIIAAFGN